MRGYYYEFQISKLKLLAVSNKQPILVPDSGVQITRTDTLSDDSGYDESYVYHRRVARSGVYKFDFSYANVTLEEYRYMEELLLRSSDYFMVYFRDLNGEQKEIKAYCSKVSASLYNAKTGHYKKLKFTIQEC